MLFENRAHVGSFKGFCLCLCLRQIATQSNYACTQENFFVSVFVLVFVFACVFVIVKVHDT